MAGRSDWVGRIPSLNQNDLTTSGCTGDSGTKSPARRLEDMQWARMGRWLLYVVTALTLVGALVWFGWQLWVVPVPGTPRPDRWLDVMLGVGSFAAVGGFLGGVYVAARYGRKASVSLTASATRSPGGNGVILAARPSVKAVGVFRVRFHDRGAGTVKVTELFAYEDEEGYSELEDGPFWYSEPLFQQQFVEGGEELLTTATFPLPSPAPAMVGWRVSVEIDVPYRFLRRHPGWQWVDQVFVPVPEVRSV